MKQRQYVLDDGIYTDMKRHKKTGARIKFFIVHINDWQVSIGTLEQFQRDPDRHSRISFEMLGFPE